MQRDRICGQKWGQRPEKTLGGGRAHYIEEEAARYTNSDQTIRIQKELATRAIDLVTVPVSGHHSSSFNSMWMARFHREILLALLTAGTQIYFHRHWLWLGIERQRTDLMWRAMGGKRYQSTNVTHCSPVTNELWPNSCS